MLKLRRVELQGFKSFCDRTEMRFHGAGIAAVVGPNGCGKSNLSDAISWVLGEQSAKTLRGSRMEDVIFAGTRDRKPLGMAQVTMTLADPKVDHADTHAALPVNGHQVEVHTTNGHANGHATNGHGPNGHTNGANGYGLQPGAREVTITRRLYRSGDSEYLIDGKHARLRDIQDLFMGTGLGPESYAIIEQGRIGQLLSSKPADRRAVIEEAAGVSKFKTKRRLAESKLESAKQNLSRVFDILEEVGRQAASLKRQAAKAKRYQELHTGMVEALRTTLVGRYQMLEREAAKIAIELNLANTGYQTLAELVRTHETDHQQLQEQAYATERDLTAARERLAALRLEAERTRGRLESQARQIAAIDERLVQGDNEGRQIDERQQLLATEIEAAATRLAEIERETGEARERLLGKTEERDAATAQLRHREQTIEAGRHQVLRLLGEVSTLRNQLAQAETYLQSLDRDTARLLKEEQIASADLETLEARKQQVSESLAARQMELESIGEQKSRVDQDLAHDKEDAARARRDLEQARADVARLKARKDSLEEILSHRAYTTESVKRLFTAIEQGQAQELKPVGVLADFVDVEAAFEKAAEEFLHEELEWVIVKDWSQAECGIDVMRTDLDGRATFLVHPEPGDPMSSPPAIEPAMGPETGIVARLSDALRMTNGLTQAPAALIPRLARCFLAEDRGAAQRLARQYPDFYFLLNDGVCYHGHAVSGGRKTGSGPLALKRELRELTSQLSTRQRSLEETLRRLEGLDAAIAALGSELERLRGLQHGQEREALALDHEMRRLAEEFARSNSRLSVSRLELERIGREREKALQKREQGAQDVERMEIARHAQEEALTEARAALDEIQDHVALLAEEHSALRVDMAAREERRRSESAAQARLEAQNHELLRRRTAIAAEMERLGVDRARLLADNIGLDERAAQLASDLEQADAVVNALAAREAQERGHLAALDETLRQMRSATQEAQDKRARIELTLVERRAALKYLEETCQKELKASLDELSATQETALDEIGLAEAEDRYNGLKTKIENLGPVNPQALEEFEEAQQRYDFLNAQRQDLLDSIRDTEKAIQDIDVESRKRFTEAFSAINGYFRTIFEKLFGGGAAEMRLTDEANVNDCGIDIVASPPGKRLQNVLLLSGGEKALTALSLLMAIFRFTPSPFCILDEVDAPLDEPNIERLMKLLREMSHQTQFVIITHAKRTMEAAASLYGVTMQEAGVSKLVSVRFNPPPVAVAPPEAIAVTV